MPGWPILPQTIMSDQVVIRRVTGWNQDAAGGRVPTYGRPTAPVDCAITKATAADRDLHSRESMVVSHTISFASYPGLNLRDEVTWVGLGLVLAVVGVAPAGAADSRTWDVFCQGAV